MRRIIIKTDKGAIGALAAPVFVAVGAIAALASKFTIEVVKSEDNSSKKTTKRRSTKK